MRVHSGQLTLSFTTGKALLGGMLPLSLQPRLAYSALNHTHTVARSLAHSLTHSLTHSLNHPPLKCGLLSVVHRAMYVNACRSAHTPSNTTAPVNQIVQWPTSARDLVAMTYLEPQLASTKLSNETCQMRLSVQASGYVSQPSHCGAKKSNYAHEWTTCE